MPVHKTLYPYAVSQELHLRPHHPYDPSQEGLEFSWAERAGDEGELSSLTLTGKDRGWRRLRMRLDADLPLSELERVLPSSTAPESETRLIVSVTCATTKFRKAVELERTGRSTWSGEVTVARDDVRSVVELRPILARRTGIPTEREVPRRKATVEGEQLAEGRGIRLYIDEIHRAVHGALQILWADFKEAEQDWLNERASDLFFLEPYGEEPKLWLNSSYTALEHTLRGTDRRGVDAGIRHLTNALIAQTVWVQLFLTGAAEVLREDSSDGGAPTGWKANVISNFLPRLFPEAQTDEDRRSRLREMLRSPDQYGTLMALSGSAAQDIVGSGELFEKAVRAVEEADRT